MIDESKIIAAEKCLIDNGIEADEASTVLQAIGYILLDSELYPDTEAEKCADLTIKPEYEESRKEKAAADFIEAIKTLASKPENLENLKFYLEQHFPVWMKKWAYDPDSLAAEMKEFANMEI